MLSGSASSRSASLDDEDDNGTVEVSFMGERLAFALRPTSQSVRALAMTVTQSCASSGHSPLPLGGYARDMSHRAGPAMESPTPSSDTVVRPVEVEAHQHDLVLEVVCTMGVGRHLDLWLRIGRHAYQLGCSSEGAAHWLDAGRLVRLRWLVPLFGEHCKDQSRVSRLSIGQADTTAGAGYDQIVRIVARHRRHASEGATPPHRLFYASTTEKTAEAVVCFVTRRPGFRVRAPNESTLIVQLAPPAPAPRWWRFACFRLDAFGIRGDL